MQSITQIYRLIIIALLLSSPLYSKGQISGIVTNNKGNLVSNALVEIAARERLGSQTYRTRTNNNGQYKIKKIKNGTYLLKISYGNYETYYKNVIIKGGLIKQDKKEYNVILKPRPKPKPIQKVEESLTGTEILRIIMILFISLVGIWAFTFGTVAVFKYIRNLKLLFKEKQKIKRAKSKPKKTKGVLSKIWFKIKNYFLSFKIRYKERAEKKRIERIEKKRLRHEMEEKSRMQLEKTEKRRFEQNKIIADIQKEKSSVENPVKSQTDLKPDTNTQDIIIKIIGFTCFVYINTLFRWDINKLVMYAPLIQDGQIWRFVSPVFAHANLMHLAGNMYVLYLISDMCSVLYKKDSFLFRYIIFGIAGNIISFIFTFNNPVPCLGASGAILGVCGMLLGHQKNAKTGSPITFYNLEPMWVYIIISIVGGFTQSGIDNGAHIGGFAAGFYWGYNIIAPKENKI